MRRLTLILSLFAAPALAGETGLTTLVTGDDSRGWEAVGRLDLGGNSFCTGALIAPDLVLTAAHCLYSPVTGALIDAGQVQFRAGWRNGRAVAYRGARRALVHPDYLYTRSDRIDRVAHDIALVELDQPIRLPSIRPFATAKGPRPGTEVGVVSYALDRSEAPSLQEVCTVLHRQGAVLMLSCSVEFGASGAPVFLMGPGAPQIVSLVSAKAEVAGQRISLGTVVEDVDTLRAALGQRRGLGLPGQATDTGGARFIRP